MEFSILGPLRIRSGDQELALGGDKQRRILAMLVLGYSIDEMAADLYISRNYVYLLIRQLRVRFLAKTNTAVVVRALTMGLITSEGKFLK